MRVQKALQKARMGKHRVADASFQGEEVRINLTLTLISVWNPMTQLGAQNTISTRFLWKDRCFWRGTNRKTHQKSSPPRPPISSWRLSNTVSVLTNYLKRPLDRLPAHTHGQAQHWFLHWSGLTDLSPEFKTVNSFLLPQTLLVLTSKCHCGLVYMGPWGSSF